jgi:hypothetical protein
MGLTEVRGSTFKLGFGLTSSLFCKRCQGLSNGELTVFFSGTDRCNSVHHFSVGSAINPLTPYEANDPSLGVNMMHVKICFWLILDISEIAFFPRLSEQH